MTREERERLADDLLERALSHESVEPPDGLERRILVHLDARSRDRGWGPWLRRGGWAAAVAAAAIVVLFGLRSMHREPAPPLQAEAALPKPAVEPPATLTSTPTGRTASSPRRPAAGGRRAPRREALPRQEVFPTPVPLTEEERLLLALVNGQKQEAEKVAMLQQAERDEFQKYLETGEAPEAQPMPAHDVR